MPGIKECVCVHIGQAGCQVGFRTWELFTKEHEIQPNGMRGDHSTDFDPTDDEYTSFFHETGTGQYVPRAVFVDTEPTVINNIKSGKYGKLFHPDSMLCFKQDAKNNFFEGRTIAAAYKVAECTMDRIRLAAELCNNLQGFMCFHAFGGGTGSGVGVEVLEDLREEFGKKCIFQPAILPSLNYSNSIVEPYNTMFAIHYTRDRVDLSFMLDNEAAYRICEQNLQIKSPHFSHVNRLIAQCISGATSALRYETELNSTLNEQLTNLVPRQPFRYMMMSLSPLRHEERSQHEQFKTAEIVNELFEEKNLLCDCQKLNFNRYLAACVLLRGESSNDTGGDRVDSATAVMQERTLKSGTAAARRHGFKPIQVNAVVSALQALRNPPANKSQHRGIKFCPWMEGSGIKVGIIRARPVIPEGFAVAKSARQGIMIGNNTAVRQVFLRQYVRFLRLYYHKAYIWQFIEANGEPDAFEEAKDSVREILNEYESIMGQCAQQEDERLQASGTGARSVLRGTTEMQSTD